MKGSESGGLGRWTWLLHGFVLASAVGLSLCAVLRFRGLLSDWAFDLAFFHNLIANAANGNGFLQSSSLHEADGLLNLSHAFLLLPLLVPAYWAFPHLETLLVIQSVALAFGAYPVARLAHAAGARASISVGVALLYLVSFPFWRIGLADFRPLTVAIPALLWVAFFLVTRRPLMAVVAGLFAGLCREEVPILVVAMCAALWLARRTNRRTALSVMGTSVLYFALMHVLRSRSGYYIPFDDPSSLFQNVQILGASAVSWDRPLTHLASYVPIGMFTIALEPFILVAAMPLIVYQLFFSPYEWWHWTGSYIHHTGPLLAVTATAAAAGWGRLDSWISSRTERGYVFVWLIFLASGIQAVSTFDGVSHAMGLGGGQEQASNHRTFVEGVEPLLAMVPQDSAVATDYRLIGRLSGRSEVYCYQANFENHDGGAVEGKHIPGLQDVDWMLIETGHVDWLKRLSSQAGWSQVASGGSYVLYRRSAE